MWGVNEAPIVRPYAIHSATEDTNRGLRYPGPQPQPQTFSLASLMQQGQQAAPTAQANPYQAKLNKLLSNPGAMSTSPVFKYSMDAGLEAASRGLAAKGMLNSGNRLLEMQKAGEGIASQNFFKLADLLGNLSTNTTSQNQAAQNSANSNAFNWAQLFQNQAQFDRRYPQNPGVVTVGTGNPVTFY